MGQKINPVSLRIQAKTRYIDSAWYSDHFFSNLVSIDISILRYLNNFLKSFKLPSGRFSIYHLPKTTKLYNFFCYPKQSREYKAKMFRISSGLPNLRRQTTSEKNKLVKRNGLLDSVLFQNSGSYGKKNTENFFSFLNVAFYTMLKTKLQYNLSKKSNAVVFPSLMHVQTLLKNQDNLYKSFQSSLKKESDTSINHYLTKDVHENRKYLEKKSINEKDKILTIFKDLMVISKIIHSPYKVALENSLNFSLLQNLAVVQENQNASKVNKSLKYNTHLQNNLTQFLNFDVTTILFQSSYEWQDAGYFADEIVFLLERHISFRQIKNKILKKLSLNSYIQGVRITCSGRVGGKSKKAQRARMDSIKYGQTSLNVFSSQIDFAVRTAHTPLGSTGIKVWICYK